MASTTAFDLHAGCLQALGEMANPEFSSIGKYNASVPEALIFWISGPTSVYRTPANHPECRP